VETLRILDGIVDIYMPDMKYDDEETARELSGIENYPAVNKAAIKEMHRQTGDLEINEEGVAQRGLLVRHLVLPHGLAGTKGIVNFLSKEISRNTYVNIMAQYHPCHKALQILSLGRRISSAEFHEALSLAREAGLSRLDKIHPVEILRIRSE
jgi:putative pyruvate formate lyase activating enzyme